MALSEFAKSGFLRLLAPVIDLLVRKRVSPNAITTVGTVATIVGGGRQVERTVLAYAESLAHHEGVHLEQIERTVRAVTTSLP